MIRFLWRWLPPIVWMSLIFVVSDQATLPSAPGCWDALIKKSMHALAYGVLALLMLRALRGYRLDNRWNRLVSLCLAVAYALSDEYHQSLVMGRDGTLLDVAVDGVGSLSAIVLDWLCRPEQRGRFERVSG